MQAGILDLEKPEKDRKTILREEKAKKEKRKKKEIRRHRKDKRRRITEGDDCKNWFRKNRYTRGNYSGNIIGQ